MDIWSFLSLIIVVFGLVLIIAGIFAAYFGAGKNKAYGAILAVVGLIVAVFWIYVAGPGDIVHVYLWDVFVQAFWDLVAILIGALAAVGIFLVLVLKS